MNSAMTKLQTKTHRVLRLLVAATVLCTATNAVAQARPATPAAPQPARAPARAAMRVISLTASAFTDGSMIPARHAQTGRDVSPALSWSGAPDSTRSFVLLVHDADAAIGDGTDDLLHWMVWNIPGTATSLPEGVPQGAQAAILLVVNAAQVDDALFGAHGAAAAMAPGSARERGKLRGRKNVMTFEPDGTFGVVALVDGERAASI